MENMVNFSEVMDFYKGKKVLLTGHTGFKGSWLWTILELAEADLWGYALPPQETTTLHTLCGYDQDPRQNYASISDFAQLKEVFTQFQPEFVFHLAAQPIVTIGYENPVETYQTNVMGTVHLLECCKLTPSVKSVINVTTDKVYENKEWLWGYRENENLDGFDPYANSKSCSELVTATYKRSFFSKLPVSTVRAGNVIGGGDFSPSRILPDCVRSALEKKVISVRNPYSIRPYQHVLDALFVYLLLGKEQFLNPEKAGSYNVGPEEQDCISTGEMAQLFCDKWGEKQIWEIVPMKNPPHESHYLMLDCSLVKHTFRWKPVWDVATSVDMTCRWTKVYHGKGDVKHEMIEEINSFCAEL